MLLIKYKDRLINKYIEKDRQIERHMRNIDRQTLRKIERYKAESKNFLDPVFAKSESQYKAKF